MTTGNGISISGLDDCLRWMDQMPENCVKATQTALRDASKEVTKTIRASGLSTCTTFRPSIRRMCFPAIRSRSS